MYARVARYQIPENRVGELLPSFREALDQLREVDGNTGGYLLVDPDNCTALTFTLWENQGAMQAGEMRTSRLLTGAAFSLDGDVQTVDHCEVLLPEG